VSAFNTFRAMRDSTLRNAADARAESADMMERNALMQAGDAFASGNPDMAANVLARSGNIPGAMQINDRVMRSDQELMAQQEAARERQRGALVAGAQGLRRLPMEQRWQAYQQRVAPILQQEGLDDAMLGQITQDVMDDASLDSVIMMAGGEAPVGAFMNAGGGRIVQTDPYGSGVREVYVAPQDPNEARLLEAQIAAQEALAGQRRASGQATTVRAARSGRSGGGSGGGGRQPQASAPARKPWERY